MLLCCFMASHVQLLHNLHTCAGQSFTCQYLRVNHIPMSRGSARKSHITGYMQPITVHRTTGTKPRYSKWNIHYSREIDNNKWNIHYILEHPQFTHMELSRNHIHVNVLSRIWYSPVTISRDSKTTGIRMLNAAKPYPRILNMDVPSTIIST